MPGTVPTVSPPDLAHVTFEVAPLQLAPALLVGVMYGLRAQDAARARRAGGRLAAVVLLRRARADGGHARLAARAHRRGAVPRAHARAPAAGRPRRAADRARLDRPAAAAGAERARPALAARLRAPGRRVDGLDGELLPLAPARALPERGHQRRRPRAAAHPLRLLRDRDVDGAARPAAQAGLVRQRGEDRLHHRRAADRQRAGQRAAVVQRRALSPLRRRPGRVGHHRRQRPERGGRDHDDRGLDRHHRPVLLAVPARRARERREAGAGGAGRVARRRADRGARRPRGRRRPRRGAARAHPRRASGLVARCRDPTGRAIAPGLGA